MSSEVVSPDEYLPGITVYVECMPLPSGFRYVPHIHRAHQGEGICGCT